MRKTMNNKPSKKKRMVLSQEERLRRKEQRDQKKEIRDIMSRIGFTRLNGIDGKEFVYDGRTSELDDIFICENIILLTEYTIGEPHILKKKIIYDKINKTVFPGIQGGPLMHTIAGKAVAFNHCIGNG